jgi:anti-anti-sigma factor
VSAFFDLAASGRPLVADLDQVSLIDSAGLAALVGTAKRATACGGSVYAVCSRPKIRQLFRITGLDRRIPLASTLDEALNALAAGPSCRHRLMKDAPAESPTRTPLADSREQRRR